MKRIFQLIILIFFCYTAAIAQYPIRPSTLSIDSIIRVAPNAITFSIYFKNTAVDSAIEYSGGQIHLDFNKSILNGAVGTLAIISSNLTSNVQPTNPTVYITSTPGQLRMAPKIPPGALTGGFMVNPGDSVLVAKLMFSTSASTFSIGVPHNISWRKEPDANPVTKVAAYIWDNNNIISTNTSFFIYPLTNKELSITALVEGFYNNTTNAMVSDTVTVELHNASTYTLVDQAKTVLNTSGAGIANFFSAADATNYYLVLKHRNSIETWSKTPQMFSGGSLTYDFTTAANKAYGDNLKQIDASPVKFGIYSGDVPIKDGLIDLTDVIAVINDVNGFAGGPGLVTDLNGDDTADLTDIIIVVNNANAFISKQTPEVKSNMSLKTKQELKEQNNY